MEGKWALKYNLRYVISDNFAKVVSLFLSFSLSICFYVCLCRLKDKIQANKHVRSSTRNNTLLFNSSASAIYESRLNSSIASCAAKQNKTEPGWVVSSNRNVNNYDKRIFPVVSFS